MRCGDNDVEPKTKPNSSSARDVILDHPSPHLDLWSRSLNHGFFALEIETPQKCQIQFKKRRISCFDFPFYVLINFFWPFWLAATLLCSLL